MIKAVIVDDEPKAIQSLTWELENFSNDIEVVETFTNPEKAITYLKTHTPDCLFLDINMPTMDGFQFLDCINHKDYAVIITTAYNEYALKALKNEAIDYLLKPIDSDDLKETIAKIKKFYTNNISIAKVEEVLLNFNANLKHQKVILNTDGKLVFLNIDDILYIESDGNYSTFFMTKNQKMVVTKKIKEIDAILPENYFFRIHNSYIINLNKIKEFVKNEAYVVMESNEKIPVARQRKSDFLNKL
ncbi:MAG: DNA-binding response regulator [Xanthomarina sp.]|uniref:LytR/AlgR family response regulator transcription factor n=1 Tax=Xanthomarina TaxID=1868329 RepID=UPI000C4E1BEE|nr:LytTR family DNA-binding domain-containing protein [Xanthomarina sp.]MAL23859.1 DNA-binding response regulator [Xanthomarina sp.]MBF61934.1 DNA-binding response regulator [Xanthomarina sp.]HAB28290.1 DNA-binding response regulator [Xanthomarina gelatinilytica]|tara:strand:- start:5328 stop:6062 length:735 start_codon:yes stop_codon:yes gene_type:complete